MFVCTLLHCRVEKPFQFFQYSKVVMSTDYTVCVERQSYYKKILFISNWVRMIGKTFQDFYLPSLKK